MNEPTDPGGRPASRLPWCLGFSLALAASIAVPVTAQDSDSPLDPNSPWLIVPTVSSDPKLSHSVGVIAGYLPRFDAASTQSIIAGFGTYSDTDSWFTGVFGDLYFGADRHKVTAGLVTGRVKNEYDDFLGTGVRARTEDTFDGVFARYLHRVGEDWYLGGQVLSSNYAIGAEGLLGGILGQIGLTGFDSTGLGAVLERETRDNVRNATRGSHFIAQNIAYRQTLGGDESFDVYRADFSHYLPFGNGHVLATQLTGRWTHNAPLGGYSSINLRGYTRGNYLAEHYSHLDVDARFALSKRWGAAVFAGLGCLYGSLSDCGHSDELYPSAGAGVIYLLKPEAGFVIRLDAAWGKEDNSAVYLKLGQPF